jgi:hypothetical protein
MARTVFGAWLGTAFGKEGEIVGDGPLDGVWHGLIYQPIPDHGGPRDTCCLQIPETSEEEFDRHLEETKRHSRRLVIVCDTAKQAEEIARKIGERLPRHRIVALERVFEGGMKLE